MSKNIILSAITAVSLLSLTGCGGSDSKTPINTGTGYYIDAAVIGADVACGSIVGKTENEGKFTFEEGKKCTFSLAGVQLREVAAADLKDEETIFENNLTVARFLQAIDKDGDPSNGIQVDKEVVSAVTTALKNANQVGKLPTGADLEAVIAHVDNEVKTFRGRVHTDTEVQEHLTSTQTDITKALLANKTFYIVDDSEDRLELLKIIINKDVTQFKVFKSDGTADGVENVVLLGNKLTFQSNTDGSYAFISQSKDYLFADDRNADGSKDGVGTRLYTSQSDAQAYFDSIKTKTPFKLSDLVGKTLYQHVKSNGQIGISEMTVQADGKLKIIDFSNTELLPYRIEADTIYTTAVDEEEQAHKLLEKTDKYVKFRDSETETTTFYFTKKDAQASPVKEIGNNNENLNNLIAGKTKYYRNSKGAIGSRTYAIDGTYTGNFNGSDVSGTYTIEGNTLNIVRTSGDADINIKLTMLNITNDVINFDISVNDGATFQSSSYSTEEARDASSTTE